MSVDWDKRQGAFGKHKHLPSDILSETTGDPDSGSAGVLVDNGTDPPAAVTTLVAPGADVSVPGEATLEPVVHAAVLYGAITFSSGNPVQGWAVDFDTDGFASVDGTGFTIPAGMAGAYLLNLVLNWSYNNPPTYVQALIDIPSQDNLNAPFATGFPPDSPGADGLSLALAAMVQFAEGDVIKAVPEWASGSSVDSSSFGNCQFSITYLGPLP